MKKERWRRVKSLLALALEQPPENRKAFIVEAAGDDAELLGEILSLLEAHDRPEGFTLERAAAIPTAWRPLDAAPSDESYSKVCSRCNSRYGPLVFVCPQDGEPLADDPEALVGQTLDDLYLVEAFVGHGAMGRVYRARHLLLRDTVAIKVLRSDLALNGDFVRRFLREGRAARAICHPNAVTVHDLRTTVNGLTYMVQEFVDGHTLRAEMTKGEPVSLERVLEFLEPVAAALDEAHAHGVVHRDLKPENVMIGTVGGRRVVKLTDLGIAKMCDTQSSDQSGLTSPGQVMGTPHYMSPEQWGATPEDGGPEIDARADVYSFGIIAFELLAGRKPFDVESVRQLCLAHVSSHVPELRSFLPDLPPGVSDAVARAMAKDRGDRHPSCGRLVGELRAACQSAHEERAVVASRTVGARTLVLATCLAAVALAAAAMVFRSSAPLPAAPSAAASVPRVATRSIECTVEFQKYRDGRPVKTPVVVSAGKTLMVEAGDRVRFTIRGEDGGHLYVLNETAGAGGAEDSLRVLFPVSWTNAGSPSVAAREPVALPTDPENWIEFDDERGTETFWIVWSAAAVPALDGIAGVTNPRDRGSLDAARSREARDFLASAARGGAEHDPVSGRTIVRGDARGFVHRVDVEHY